MGAHNLLVPSFSLLSKPSLRPIHPSSPPLTSGLHLCAAGWDCACSWNPAAHMDCFAWLEVCRFNSSFGSKAEQIRKTACSLKRALGLFLVENFNLTEVGGGKCNVHLFDFTLQGFPHSTSSIVAVWLNKGGNCFPNEYRLQRVKRNNAKQIRFKWF